MSARPDRIISPHGGYRKLKAYHLSEIIHDGTVAFCKRCFQPRSRTAEQMTQAARSAKQNIAEGSSASGTSKKIELKLVGIARASLEELLQDYQDFLRQNKLELWTKDHPRAVFIRNLSKRKPQADPSDPSDRSDPSDPSPRSPESYALYQPYIEHKSLETAANTLLCLIHQANFLLDQLLRRLERDFVEKGGFTERLHAVRSAARRSGKADPSDQSDRSDLSDQSG